MACQRCGGRMLTKVGSKTKLLVCSDCGTPVPPAGSNSLVQDKQTLASSLLLLAMGGFFLLIFFLTYGPRLESETARDRSLIRKSTAGALERPVGLIEQGQRHAHEAESPD